MLGKYEKKGATTFVLDMMVRLLSPFDDTLFSTTDTVRALNGAQVTDDECWTVQHMLHEIEEFGVVHSHCAGRVYACLCVFCMCMRK